MPVAKRWIAIGTLLAAGAMWFAARAMRILTLESRDYAWWYVLAFAIGAAAGGAVIARHASVRAWCEPVIAIVLALAFFVIASRVGRDANNSVVGPVGLMSNAQVVLVSVLSIAGAYGGALVGRGFTGPPSTTAIIVLSGLLMNGVMMFALGALSAMSGTHRLSGAFVPFVLISPLIAGYVTQSIIAARRPWTCASGGLLLLLLFLQQSVNRSIGNALIGVATLTVLGWIGARIAVRVHRARFASQPVAVPEAQVVER